MLIKDIKRGFLSPIICYSSKFYHNSMHVCNEQMTKESLDVYHEICMVYDIVLLKQFLSNLNWLSETSFGWCNTKYPCSTHPISIHLGDQPNQFSYKQFLETTLCQFWKKITSKGKGLATFGQDLYIGAYILFGFQSGPWYTLHFLPFRSTIKTIEIRNKCINVR